METSNYEMFKYYPRNRNVTFRDEMLQQAKLGFISPVIINETHHVIDGQNRIYHSKIAGMPVKFMVVDGLDEDDIVRMNVFTNPWKLRDYIESHANDGKVDYIQLKKLIDQKYTTMVSIASILENRTNNASGAVEGRLKSGDFKIYNKDKAVEFLEFYKDLTEKFIDGLNDSKNMSLVIYEIYRRKGIDKERLKRQIIREGQNELVPVSKTFGEIMKVIKKAYNKGLGDDSNIRFRTSTDEGDRTTILNELEDWANPKFKEDK